MNDPFKDMQGFASQYLDLWQEQLKSQSSEKMMSDAMKTVQFLNAETQEALKKYDSPDKLQDWMNTWATTWKEKMGNDTNFPFPFPPETFGAQTDRDASGDAERNMDELTQRITTLEKRIVELESELKDKG